MPERPVTLVLTAPDDPALRPTFIGRISAHLARHEAENNLPLSVVDGLDDARFEAIELLLAIDPADEPAAAPLAALVWTPPFNVLLSYADEPKAREALLANLLARGAVPPGVTGPEPDVGAVAAWLAKRTGRTAELSMRQGVYKLEAVNSDQRQVGTMRSLVPADAATFVPWLAAFNQDVNLTLRSAEEQWQVFMGSPNRSLQVLEVAGEAVCLVGIGGATPNGRRIGPVYTPPEHRRHGYAGALVAKVCEQILAAGSRFCFLYTDLDYEASNSVYRKVGFELVLESAEYALQPVGR